MQCRSRPREPLGRRRGGLVGDHPVVALCEANVGQPLAGETFDVVQERGDRCEDLPVAGPTGTFAVGAVGRDLAHVAAQTPDDRVVQPVDALVVTLEPTRSLEIVVHHDAPNVLDVESLGMALDTDVPEAVRREARLEHITGYARRDDAVDLAGRERLRKEREVDAEVVGRDVAVGIEPLAVRQREFRAQRTEVGQPRPSIDVLAEIDDLHTGPDRRDGHGDDLLHASHRRRLVLHEADVRRGSDGDR